MPTVPRAAPSGEQVSTFGTSTPPYAADSAPLPYPLVGEWMPPPPRGRSVASLVLGIVSVVLWWIGALVPLLPAVVPIVGLVLGILGVHREPAGRGFAVAGIWINGIVLGVSLLIVLAVLALVAAGLIVLPYLAGDPELPANA